MATFPERECSIQRRHQKVLEETPSPFVSLHPEIRQSLRKTARALASSIKYRSAGTVEYILDDETGAFYFLEVNTRLQVEHGITELVSGVDIVAWQFQLQGALPPKQCEIGSLLPKDISNLSLDLHGSAIEVRICAEDPAHGYRPCAGVLGEVCWPNDEVRVDTWIESGSEVTSFYDSLLGKLMVHSSEGRNSAIKKMQKALKSTRLAGVTSNLDLLRAIVSSPKFVEGSTTTKFLDGLEQNIEAIEIIEPGFMTSVQDYPGRTKMWSVGVPPSGPMDSLSHRMANALVGNCSDEAALEIGLVGPTIRFLSPRVVAVCGSSTTIKLDGQEMPHSQSFSVSVGQSLSIGNLENAARAYLAISGGLDVPKFLGSRSTFPAGCLGGHQGRVLRAGDMLPLGSVENQVLVGTKVPEIWRPPMSDGELWKIKVLPGPQADPDYFTRDDISQFYSTDYVVHHNSNRLGIRLEGPRPKFARTDGGEGGSHPSNVHDHVYAIGTVNFTGDMPVVLMVDGPSLGGFVCPATIITSELWKMGQVKAGDKVRFIQTTIEEAFAENLKTDMKIQLIEKMAHGKINTKDADEQLNSFCPQINKGPETKAVLANIEKTESHPGAQIRLAGDRYIFVEYGPMELDLNLRVRVEQLQDWLSSKQISGLIETSPGVRSLMIEYDARILDLDKLLNIIFCAEKELEPANRLVIPSRIIYLPLAFNDRWTKDAILRYSKSVRSEAPYLPSNIQFVAENNGIKGGDAISSIQNIIESASYMVMGLGDVYLGAPCAVPIDPRHRLVVPKYNPARTYTPEGAVGIGGCYMCIYPMNSPGGYQLVGRTIPIWNSYTRVGPFEKGKPWLLRNFDQIRYFVVSEDELEDMRHEFKNGKLRLRIEESEFDMAIYNDFTQSVEQEVQVLKSQQKMAMEKMLRLDAESLSRLDSAKTLDSTSNDSMSIEEIEDPYHGHGGNPVRAAVTGTVWEVRAKVGDIVAPGDILLVLEAMKMEFEVVSSFAGQIKDIAVTTGDMVSQGASLCLIS